MNQSAAAQDVPDMMSECPICLEPLFDEQGIACNGYCQDDVLPPCAQ
jgi:hypothetical protein